MPVASDRPPDSLEQRIRSEIRDRGPISFARFMEHALYDPDEGYYAGNRVPLGKGGDFHTASDVGPAFGACMARQLGEIDRRFGPFEPFDVLEFGAGRGWLARDVIDALARTDTGLARRIRTTLVDRSPAMRRCARDVVPEARCLAPDQVGGGYRGCVLAVELFDALPVHRVRCRAAELFEVRVGLDEAGRLIETERPAGPRLVELARSHGLALEEGEAELCAGASAQLAVMAGTLDRGALLVVDYGGTAPELYRDRPAGTLLAYRRHQTNQRYLEHVGRQDLTSHVNFSVLVDQAAALGLDVVGLTTQDRFLIANGILEVFDTPEAEEWARASSVKRRMQALQLIHPEGMGRIFKVLALARGGPLRLDGMRDPFERAGTRGPIR